MTAITKIWRSSEWKKKRAEFLEGKTCVWCGSDKILTPHHLKHYSGLAEYNKVVSQLIERRFANGQNNDEKQALILEVKKKLKRSYSLRCPKCNRPVKARKTITPKFKCYNCGLETDKPKRRLDSTYRSQKQLLFRRLFAERHRAEIEKAFSEVREKALEEYLSFNNVEPMCRKCHYAREKNMVLCKFCRNNYHFPKYEKCFQCFAKTDYGAKLIRDRKDLFYGKSKTRTYKHPWCGKTFEIEEEFWEIEACPNMCCIEHCEIDSHGCDNARKK